MTYWVRECITTPRFSIAFNGGLVGYFKVRRGLRQGDLLPPYLFVLVMEVFLRMLQSVISRSNAFRFHPKCEALKVTRLCFADDWMLFSSANIHSVTIFQDTLEAFKRISGLSANPTKTENFLSAVPAHLKHQILEFLQFKEGKLPVNYLGVPLISGR